VTIGFLLGVILCPILYLSWLEDEILQFRVNAIPQGAAEKQLVEIFGQPSSRFYSGSRKILGFPQSRWDGRDIVVWVEIYDGVASGKVVGATRSILARLQR
jgi:hypothetical protein